MKTISVFPGGCLLAVYTGLRQFLSTYGSRGSDKSALLSRPKRDAYQRLLLVLQSHDVQESPVCGITPFCFLRTKHPSPDLEPTEDFITMLSRRPNDKASLCKVFQCPNVDISVSARCYHVANSFL